MYGSVKESIKVRNDLGGLPYRADGEVVVPPEDSAKRPEANGDVHYPEAVLEGEQNNYLISRPGHPATPRQDIPSPPSRGKTARRKDNSRAGQENREGTSGVSSTRSRVAKGNLKRNDSASSLGYDKQPANQWLDRSVSVPVGSGGARPDVGVATDEDVNDVISSLTHHGAGRRSAPLFTRRSFGTKTFWNDGQTSINRLAKQEENGRQGFKGNFWNGGRSYKRSKKPQSDRSKTCDDVEQRNVKGTSSTRRVVKPITTSKNNDSQNNKIFDSNCPITSHHTATPTDTHGYFSDFDGNSHCVVPHGFRENLESDASCNLPRPSTGQTSNDILEHEDETMVNNLLEDSVGKLRSLGAGGFRNSRNILQSDSVYTNTDDGSSAVQPHANPQYIEDDHKDKDFGSTDQDSDESSSLLDDKTEYVGRETKTAVYMRRWYLLFLFSVFAVVWNAVWSTWGPIAQSAKVVYNWSDSNIAMFTWLGNAPFLVTMFPFAYLMDVKGMRVSMILCCALTFIGAGLRCIPANADMSTWLIYGGQLLNGIAGTVPMAGPGLLSGLWFPPNQRATATAISTVAGYLGSCVSFVIGPLLVNEPGLDNQDNSTGPTFLQVMDSGNSSNATDTTALKDGIMNILYFECGAAGLIFLLVVIYFPSKPPRPPSVSASIPREKYLQGIKSLVTNKQFWVTALAYSVPVGVYEVWQVVLDVNLNPRVSQQTAGWMDFFSTIGGCVSGLLVSRFADYFTRQIKLCLILFYFLAAVAALWMSLLGADYLPFDTVSVYAAVVIVGVFLDGAAPLFFELVIEVSYPVGEGVTSGFLQLITAGSGMAFLSLLQDESIGKEWMNWCFFGCIAAALPLLFFINTVYARADIDDMEVDVSSEDEDDVTSILAPEESERRSLLNSSHV